MKKSLFTSAFVFLLLFLVVPSAFAQSTRHRTLPQSCSGDDSADVLDYAPADLPPENMIFVRTEDGGRWQFTGLVTAICSLDFQRFQVRLAEVSYRGISPFDGEPQVYSIWITTAIQFPPDEISLVEPDDGQVELGMLVSPFIAGPHISQRGVDWSLCTQPGCSLLAFLDTLSGVSNTQLMIEGSYPSRTCPEYGFLPWSVSVPVPDENKCFSPSGSSVVICLQ